MDLETFLVSLYVLIDDWWRVDRPRTARKPGRPSRLTDAEVLTLAVLAQWPRFRSAPVREALAILTQLGIIEQYPQAGFAVRRVDAAEASKVLNLQKATERLIVREAAAHRTRSYRLNDVVDKLANAAVHEDCAGALELARTFHMDLAREAGYASAADVLGGFRDRYALFIADSRPLDGHELSETASIYRYLVLAIEADDTGDEGEDILDQLIGTEVGFVCERSAAQHELQPTG